MSGGDGATIASHEVLLDGQRVSYTFKRSQRHSIGFSVSAEGLAVSAPKWVPLPDIDQALQKKSAWILRKLGEVRARHERLETARVIWRDGVVLPFRGEPLKLVLDPLQRGTALHRDRLSGAASLHVTLEPGSAMSPTHLQDAFRTWLKQQARLIFTERLDHFAPQLGVQWRQPGVSSAATRWGSASANGAIRLNWLLLHVPPTVLDYVVVHELSHLRVMNHSPHFWATVQSVMPDYAARRRQLKELVLMPW